LSGLASNNKESKMVNSYYGYEQAVPVFADNNSEGDKDSEGYQILVGIFRSMPAAQYTLSRLANVGYYTTIYEDEGLYQVRVGDYSSIEEALIAQRELRDRGYETLIVRALNGNNSVS
ncbi:MAG: SPOR domain-containing protein, partial [Lachnospiraceae bacterium]|nr:SPOR domain-containing protein [Lachnospiraceae bacterium]